VRAAILTNCVRSGAGQDSAQVNSQYPFFASFRAHVTRKSYFKEAKLSSISLALAWFRGPAWIVGNRRSPVMKFVKIPFTRSFLDEVFT